MKKLMLTLSGVTIACLLLNAFAFAQQANPPQSAISIEADSIRQLIPVQEIGVLKEGPANIPITASGNVVVVVEGVRVTANSAVWHRRENRIELNGGSVQLELPRQPTSFRLTDRP